MRLPLVVLVLLALFVACQSPDSYTFVSYVIDGDTFVTDSDETIRLYNIDAPEMGTPEGEAARNALIYLIDPLNDSWRLVDIDRKGEDKYGRTLACIGRGGNDIGEAMIRLGHAQPWIGAECE